jgi:hypothetical protein
MTPRKINPQPQPELLSVALALLGRESDLSPDEAAAVAGIKPCTDKALVERFRIAITQGNDPLGDCFCELRNAVDRRRDGQTFTPAGIVSTMIRKAQAEAEKGGAFAKVVDGGAGTGRFALAAGRAFRKADILAIESDPVCAVLLRANIAVAGMTDRVSVLVSDFREVKLPSGGRRLFIGNPPYVRHHDIGEDWKKWYAATMRTLGADKTSKLAGLHLHFFARVGEIAKPGDVGIFVTAAEWIDTNYGAALRASLCARLGGVSVHVVDAKAEPFPGVMTTAAITVFHPHQVPTAIKLQAVANVGDLGTLSGGVIRSATDLASQKKWYPRFFSPATVHVLNAPKSGTRVGSLFRVSRGQVTGANHIWISGEKAVNLPARFLLPCITGANELFAAGGDGWQLKRLDHLKRVVDLPRDLNTLSPRERTAVAAFLEWAEQEGGNSGYIATHRSPWWAIRLLPAAPIVCTYMARRPPVFIRNIAGARLLNIAHGLYPRSPMSDVDLDRACLALNKASSLSDGRVYAGGLTKFEPSAVEDMFIDWTSFTWLEAAV